MTGAAVTPTPRSTRNVDLHAAHSNASQSEQLCLCRICKMN